MVKNHKITRIAPIVMLGVMLTENRPVTRTRLVKILFILRQETDINVKWSFYDFLPYKHGPYSFLLNRDINSLRDSGLISGNPMNIAKEQRKQAWDIYERIPSRFQKEIEETIYKYKWIETKELVDRIYKEYPDYTILSERNSRKPQRIEQDRAVYTIGYEGRSADNFLHILIRQGLRCLIDVRNNPLSRNFGFSKKTLSSLCKNLDIEYVHFPELGIKSEKRKALCDFKSYEMLFDEYEKERLTANHDTIESLAELMQEKTSALLCYEADPRFCHRSRLANWVASKSSLPVKHLGGVNVRNEKDIHNC